MFKLTSWLVSIDREEVLYSINITFIKLNNVLLYFCYVETLTHLISVFIFVSPHSPQVFLCSYTFPKTGTLYIKPQIVADCLGKYSEFCLRWFFFSPPQLTLEKGAHKAHLCYCFKVQNPPVQLREWKVVILTRGGPGTVGEFCPRFISRELTRYAAAC